MYSKEQILKALNASFLFDAQEVHVGEDITEMDDISETSKNEIVDFFFEQLDIAANKYSPEELITVAFTGEEECNFCKSRWCTCVQSKLCDKSLLKVITKKRLEEDRRDEKE